MAIVSTYPVNFKYGPGLDVDTLNPVFNSSDGVYYNLVPMMLSAKDASFNQDTLSILSSPVSLAYSLSAKADIDETTFITQSIIRIDKEYVRASYDVDSVPEHTTDINEASLFTFHFNTNTCKVSISYGDNYLTRNGSNPLKMAAKDTPNFATTQTFNYTLYENRIALFSPVDNKIVYHYGIPNLQWQIFAGFTFENLITLERFTHFKYSSLGESNNVKYHKASNDISVQLTTDKLPYNYLVFAPYNNIDATTNNLPYNITPLKNYYSPEHVQTPTLSSVSRYYNKIFTGLNLEGGNDKIYLSYLGSEITKVFTKDKDTYFHYSVSAVNVPLSASTLIKAGALPGSSPWRSDRLFVKRADYRKYSSWGNNTGKQDGTLFCTWLSASEVGAEPVWMDRYYDPNFINTTTVLSSYGVSFSNNNFPNVIWDVPSSQTLNPESLYVYHRIGDTDNTAVVETLSSTLTHYIKEWTNPLVNDANGLSAGFIANFGSTSVATFPLTRRPALNTNTSYASLDLNVDDFNSKGFTLAFNAYNYNWSNVQGGQIIGNYYAGGIGVFNNNPLLTPFITVVGDNVNTYNTNFTTLNYNNSVSLASGSNIVVKGKYDESYFIVDVYRNVYEFDQDGTLTSKFTTIQNAGEILLGAHLIFENNTRKILLVLKNGNDIVWRKYKTNGALDSSGAQVSINNYALDLSANFTYYNGKGNSTVNSKNIIYALNGDILIKDLAGTTTSILSARQAEYIACDHEDNLWILYSNKNLCKTDEYGTVIWDVSLTSDAIVPNGASQSRIVNFIAELDINTKAFKHYGLILDGKTQNVLKVDPANGNVINTLKTTPTFNITNPTELNTILNCRPAGDVTGYDYQRKYAYPYDTGKLLKVKALVNNVALTQDNSEVKELNYDISTLTPGWHHFAITLDDHNILKLYVDGLNTTSTKVGDLSGLYRVYNKRNNPDLIIGTSSFKTEDLAIFTKLTADPYSFNGYIADVRFYSQALYQSDIKALQKYFHTDSFSNLTWAAPTGQRYYIERIDRFFPHRQPGAKSQMFNIRIKNSNINDSNLQNIIEQNIIATLSKTIPVYTKLNKIIWE